METLLQVEDLAIGYPDLVVAEDVSVELAAGELVCLLGPNGAGKTTLMRTLAGMQVALGGRVLLDGEDVHEMPARRRARRLAVVLTERVHPGLLTVYDLVALGRYPHTGWSGLLAGEDHAAVRHALDSIGALDLARRAVADLSDGERQKVMIARALAQEPRLLVLDEITAFLDLPRRVEVMRLLRRLAHSSGRAVLVSSHDLDLALRSADRLWLLPKGGKLEAGAPEDLVLSGAFEAAFAAEGVVFDREEGAFHVHRDARGSGAPGRRPRAPVDPQGARAPGAESRGRGHPQGRQGGSPPGRRRGEVESRPERAEPRVRFALRAHPRPPGVAARRLSTDSGSTRGSRIQSAAEGELASTRTASWL